MDKKQIIQDSAKYIDSFGNIHDINLDIEEAEKDVEKLKSNVNFRWEASEIRRAKRIASSKGLKYQSYIKSVLKQAMDRDEKNII